MLAVMNQILPRGSLVTILCELKEAEVASYFADHCR